MIRASPSTFTPRALVSALAPARSRRSIWLAKSSDTIYAPATPLPNKSAIAIIRIDGPDAWSACQALTRPLGPTPTTPALPAQPPPPPRRVRVRKIVCPETQETIDPEAVVIRFDHAQASTVELHLHGSPAIVRAVLAALSRLDGLRMAQPGEFTRRRFERSSATMNINQIVGLKHLINAETEEQRRWAVCQFDGKFRETYQVLRNQLKDSMALCEAIIDFSEDGSIDEEVVWKEVRVEVEKLVRTITIQLSLSERSEKISSGIRICLYGSPNVGKSTFMNWLVNREASIVSPYPGTTRDIVEASIDYHGYPVIISDTAGLRESEDPIERIGVGRAEENIEKADVCLHLVSATDDCLESDQLEFAGVRKRPTMVLLTKTDLVAESRVEAMVERYRKLADAPVVLPISILAETGLSTFVESLKQHLKHSYELDRQESDQTFISAYQKDYLVRLLNHLHSFIGCLDSNDVDVVIAIEELRLAAGLLSKLSGDQDDEVSADEVLGKIFQSFCIGK